MGTKNVRKTKSYITKEKNFKSVKRLQKILENVLLVFCEYLEIKVETKKTQRVKSWSIRGPLSPLKIFTLKMGTPCIQVVPIF